MSLPSVLVMKLLWLWARQGIPQWAKCLLFHAAHKKRSLASWFMQMGRSAVLTTQLYALIKLPAGGNRARFIAHHTVRMCLPPASLETPGAPSARFPAQLHDFASRLPSIRTSTEWGGSPFCLRDGFYGKEDI